MKRIRNIVIVGGGTAGWMTAAMLAKSLGAQHTITLIESDEIGTVGVGEATIPPIRSFNTVLGLDEDEFIRETEGTFKLGIRFDNWRAPGHSYIHPFGYLGEDMDGVSFNHYWLRFAAMTRNGDFGRFNVETMSARMNRFGRTEGGDLPVNHAFQFDAGLYAAYLRRYAERHGVRRQEGMVVTAHQDAENGFLNSVQLKDGQVIEGDLFVDCSGFRGLLIEETLKAGYDDWSHWLPCNRAAAVPSMRSEAAQARREGGGGQSPLPAGDKSPAGIEPYTRSMAQEAGWQWRIPLQHRTGNGYVFCSDYISEDEACTKLLSHLDGKPLKDPKVLRFTTGHRRRMWDKNVVAIGLAAGFLEPLESTSIHLTQTAITKLVTLFPRHGIFQSVIDQFNRDMLADYVNVKDFLIAHYKVTDREDTAFWERCKHMSIPDSLAARLDIFRNTGHAQVHGWELFKEASWFTVLVGQGLIPRDYHPMADGISEAELKLRMSRLRTRIDNRVNTLPDHAQFLERLSARATTG